jgi:hypothetical protein
MANSFNIARNDHCQKRLDIVGVRKSTIGDRLAVLCAVVQRTLALWFGANVRY